MNRRRPPSADHRLAGGVIACMLLVGCVQVHPGRTADEAPGAIEIADGRAGFGESDVSAWRESPPVLEAIDSARRYWSSQEGSHPEDVDVQATAVGAFTRPGAVQRLILYRMSLYPRGFPRKGLALIEGDALVRNFAFTGLAHELGSLPDIDGDGRDEILLYGSFGMGGQWTWGAGLARFSHAGIEDLGHATLYEDACGVGREDLGGPSAWRLWAVVGAGMRIQHYRRESCEAEAWEPVGEPEEFTPTPEQSYAEISLE